MPRVIYVRFDGEKETIHVPAGVSIMRGATMNGVPGIDGDCGGQCACATCHIFIDPAWQAKVGSPSPDSMEEEMLSFAETSRSNSRLACQITMSEDLDGIIVHLPENQH